MRTEDEIRADAVPERPFSNGSEHDVWADRYCYNDCVHDKPDADPPVYCPIITVALVGDGGEPMWPAEWTRRRVEWTKADGQPGVAYDVVDTCTEYEERRDAGPDDPPAEPDPPPVCDGQLDLIDAYLPTALAELTPAPGRTGGVFAVTGPDGAALLDRDALLAAAEQVAGQPRPGAR